MIFVYPPQAMYNRAVPKTKIYAHARPRKSVKEKFVAQVSEIVWKYKLSPQTTNLTARDGYSEIQVFEITLREQELSGVVLTAIDRAIPYPIIFHLVYDKWVKGVAAYKRPAQDGTEGWVIEDYFETGWLAAEAPALPLPVALDMKSLYEQVIKAYIDLPSRHGETIDALVERVRLVKKYQHELRMLEAKMNSEKQFSRKVDLNAHIREINHQITVLTR